MATTPVSVGFLTQDCSYFFSFVCVLVTWLCLSLSQWTILNVFLAHMCNRGCGSSTTSVSLIFLLCLKGPRVNAQWTGDRSEKKWDEK